MLKRKLKNGRPRFSTTSFVIWWAISNTAFCIALWGLLEISPSTAFNWPMCTVGTIGMTAMISTIQARLGQRFFKHWMQGWIDSASVGSLLSIVLLAFMSPITPASAALILTLPPVLVQAVWLWRQSRWAWLWPLTSLLVLLPAAQYAQWHESGLFAILVLLVGLAQGALQGVLISQLWGTLHKRGKLKRFLISDQSHHDAVQRLSLNETDGEIIDAEPLVHRQADLS